MKRCVDFGCGGDVVLYCDIDSWRPVCWACRECGREYSRAEVDGLAGEIDEQSRNRLRLPAALRLPGEEVQGG